MSYPRNATAPPTVTLGAILQISDGAVQTSGASVRVKIGTGAWGAGSGTLLCDSTSGVWTYLPTQAETDDTHFSVAAYKTGCVPVGVTVITSASATAGYAGIDWSKVANPTTTVGLTGTTFATSQVVASVTGNVGGNVSGSVGSISGVSFPSNFAALSITVGGAVTAGTVSDKTGYSLASGGLAAVTAWSVAITGNLSGSVGSVTGNVGGNVSGSVGSVVGNVSGNVSGSVGSIAGVTFPTNFAALGISASGYVSRVVLVDTLTTYTGNTPQTGDSYLRLGLPAGASVSADIAEVLAAASATTGAGAYTRTITVNDGTTALQGAKVRLTQGAESYVGTTNASGQVVFAVDAATWSVAITKPNYSFTPTTLVVSGTGSTTYSMSASGPTPSADPDKTTVRITCYGADTEPEASATVQLRQTTIPSGDMGNAFDGDWTTYTADASGIVDVTLWSGAEYALRRGTAGPITKFTPTGASYAVSSVVGKSA